MSDRAPTVRAGMFQPVARSRSARYQATLHPSTAELRPCRASAGAGSARAIEEPQAEDGGRDECGQDHDPVGAREEQAGGQAEGEGRADRQHLVAAGLDLAVDLDESRASRRGDLGDALGGVRGDRADGPGRIGHRAADAGSVVVCVVAPLASAVRFVCAVITQLLSVGKWRRTTRGGARVVRLGFWIGPVTGHPEVRFGYR